jgi:hypothetical protein
VNVPPLPIIAHQGFGKDCLSAGLGSAPIGIVEETDRVANSGCFRGSRDPDNERAQRWNDRRSRECSVEQDEGVLGDAS